MEHTSLCKASKYFVSYSLSENKLHRDQGDMQTIQIHTPNHEAIESPLGVPMEISISGNFWKWILISIPEIKSNFRKCQNQLFLCIFANKTKYFSQKT